jgi:hypothetical protein
MIGKVRKCAFDGNFCFVFLSPESEDLYPLCIVDKHLLILEAVKGGTYV